ncbi:UNVERIFIED_CONTAM: hypothetical protein LK11_20700 [Mumia flava]
MAASMCVFEEAGARAYREFSALAYEGQPVESDTVDTTTYVDWADEAGAPGTADCIRGRPFRDWVTEATEQVFAQPDREGTKLSGTPTVWVDGTTLQGVAGAYPTTEELAAAVAGAQTR